MKILFFSENFYPETNAAANRVFERAQIWATAGHDVTIICTAPNFPDGKVFDGYKNSWYRKEFVENIKVVRVKTFIAPNKGTFFRILDFLSFCLMGLVASFFQKRPDAVVATSPQFFTAITGWLTSKFKRRPFIFEVSDIWPASISAVEVVRDGFWLQLMESLELFLYKQAAKIIVLSPAFKTNIVSRGTDPGKIVTVVNGVNRLMFFPRKRSIQLAKQWELGDAFIVGYFGTLGMAHALSNVIEAALILEKKDQKIKILFVGSGAEKSKLINLAREKKTKNVIFVTTQPRNLMPHFWSLCDIALVHLKNAKAFSEVIPSKIFEAMATGCPIILAAPDGESKNLIESKKIGLWVPPENPQALAKAIFNLAYNEKSRIAFGQNGILNAEQYSRDKQADEMMSAIKTVVS